MESSFLKYNRIFSQILGIILISTCVFFLLLFVGIALEFGIFTAWLYAMPLCLGVFIGVSLTAGKSLRLGVEVWLEFVVVTLFPFVVVTIVFLPTVYQLLSMVLITLALTLGLYVYRKSRRAKRINTSVT